MANEAKSFRCVHVISETKLKVILQSNYLTSSKMLRIVRICAKCFTHCAVYSTWLRKCALLLANAQYNFIHVELFCTIKLFALTAFQMLLQTYKHFLDFHEDRMRWNAFFELNELLSAVYLIKHQT